MASSDSNNNDGFGGALGIGAGAVVLVVGAATYAFLSRRCSSSSSSSPSSTSTDLEGRVVCITGGNVGIGRAVSLALAKRGAKILIVCRNVEQGTQVCEAVGHDKCRVYPLDLTSYESIENFSASIVRDSWVNTSGDVGGHGLDILINNAGAMINEQDKRVVPSNRSEGSSWDCSMVVNHFGWVQLTQNLLPLLERAFKRQQDQQSTNEERTPIRIVNVGSKLEKMAALPNNTEDPNEWDEWMTTSPNPYNSFSAYSKGKFAMTASTFYWASFLEGQTGIQMVLISPGFVNTTLSRFMPLWQRVLSYPFRALILKTPEQGAETVLFAATQTSSIVSGRYYSGCKDITDTAACSSNSKSPEIGKYVWEATLRALDKIKHEAPRT